MMSLLRRLLRDKRGSIGMMFGVMSLVWFTAIAAGVDYTEMMNAKATLQNAVDAEAMAEVIQYGASNLTTFANADAAQYEAAYAYTTSAGAAPLIPSTISNLHWTQAGGGYAAYKGSTGSGSTATPFYAAMTLTGTYTPPFHFLGFTTINISVTAVTADPTPNGTGAGGCNLNSGDYDNLYWYPIPRGMQTPYVPALTSTSGAYSMTSGSKNAMFQNSGNNSCTAGSYSPPAGTTLIGFAMEDVTGKSASACYLNDYIPNSTYYTMGTFFYTTYLRLGGAHNQTNGDGNYPEPWEGGSANNEHMTNDQYGNSCGTQDWMFTSTGTSPPTIAADSGTTAGNNAGTSPPLYVPCEPNDGKTYGSCAGDTGKPFTYSLTGMAANFVYDVPPVTSGGAIVPPGQDTVTSGPVTPGLTGDAGAGYYDTAHNKAVLTDNALQIFRCSGNCVSGTNGQTGIAYDVINSFNVIIYAYTDDNGNATNYADTYVSPTNPGSPTGERPGYGCNIKGMSPPAGPYTGNNSTNYCAPFLPTSDSYQSVNAEGVMDCIANAGKGYVYFWNDMGGYPEDFNYDNMNYYWNCASTTGTNINPSVDHYAFIVQ